MGFECSFLLTFIRSLCFHLVVGLVYNNVTVCHVRLDVVKPKFIQTPSRFLTLSQFIRYSLENGNKI